MSRTSLITLKRFSAEQLVLDDHDTIVVLSFFFPADTSLINRIAIDDTWRSFAQGLLVEAVDASYALGYVDIAMQVFYPSSASRSGEVLALLNRFALRASQHWFKHRRSKDLMSAKIYESVRRELSRRFRTYLYAQQARRANAVLTALVDYSAAA